MKKYDPSRYQPVLHVSICTGEQAAGFRDRKNGRFLEMKLVRDPRDLKAFMKEFGINEKDLKKEW